MLKTGTELPVSGYRQFLPGLLAALAILILSGCASKPLLPYTTETTPLMLVPAVQSGEQDKRGRFREIFCEVLEARGDSVPDYRPCEEALTTVGTEPPGSGTPSTWGNRRV